MSSIYTTYISQVASHHYHLSEVSNHPEISDTGDNIFSGKIYCLTDTRLNTISNLDHLSEKEILTLIKESKVVDDSFKTLLDYYLSDCFDNLSRFLSLIKKDEKAECVLVASTVSTSSIQECSYYTLISISKGGVRTELTINLRAREIKIKTTSNRRLNTIEREKERRNSPSLMKSYFISYEAFDSILAYCITVLHHGTQMLRCIYRNT